jgi:hypothetical protein
MPDWFVELGTDNRPDLEFLIRELRDHRFTVEARESMVYLRATELNSLDHELDVLIRARDMLKFINGTARAFRLSYHGVRAAAVCHLREDGSWSRHIFAEVAVTSANLVGATSTPSLPASTFAEWVRLAESDADVAFTLLLLTEEGRSFRTIVQDLRGRPRCARIRLRTGSWCTASQAGQTSRTHSERPSTRPPDDPMELREAERLVREVIQLMVTERLASPKGTVEQR